MLYAFHIFRNQMNEHVKSRNGRYKKAQIQTHKNKYNKMEMYEMNSMLGSAEARIREFVGLEI